MHLPTEIVPATLKKAARPAAPRRPGKLNDISLTLIRKAVINAFDVLAAGEGREGGFRRGGDRDDYRRKEGASGEFKPEFRGGLGK